MKLQFLQLQLFSVFFLLSIFLNYISLKLRFQLITRFVHLDYDVHYDAYVDVTTFQNKMAARLHETADQHEYC